MKDADRIRREQPGDRIRREQPGDRTPDPPSLRLPPLHYAVVLLIALLVFLVVEGPVWRDPGRLETFDLAVYWSYAPIPVLVLVALFASRRLSVRSLLLNTMEIALVKYALTFAIALGLWELRAAPTPGGSVAHAAVPAAKEEPPPAPTPIAPGTTGVIEGTVLGNDGSPVEGALVYVASGLEGFVFAPPSQPLELSNDGLGFSPRIAAAQAGQEIVARSTDGSLHSLVATQAEGTAFHVALLGSGAPSRVTLREAHGIAELGCKVHQGSAAERPSWLAVLPHPFFAVTPKDGRFRFAGVPARRLGVVAWLPGSANRAPAAIDLEPGTAREVRLAL